jgi:hypothetical protein
VAALIHSQPEILLADVSAIQSRLEALQKLLGSGPSLLLPLLSSHPQLVVGPTEAVEHRLKVCGGGLG